MKTFVRILILTAVCISSRAEASGLRLSIDTSMFHFQRTTYDNSKNGNTDEGSFSSFGFGEGGLFLTNGGVILVPAMGFRIGIGGYVGKNLSFGITIGAEGGRYITESKTNYNTNKTTFTMLGYEFLPFVSYKFAVGKVQPFLTATMGYTGSTTKPKDNDNQKTNQHRFTFGGAAGLHFFVGQHISVDTSVLVKGYVGRFVNRDIDEQPNDTTIERRVKTSIRGVKLNLLLGLTVWF